MFNSVHLEENMPPNLPLSCCPLSSKWGLVWDDSDADQYAVKYLAVHVLKWAIAWKAPIETNLTLVPQSHLLVGLKLSLNLFRTKTAKYLFLGGKKPILSSNWQDKFLYFHYKSVKLDVLCRQNKIWTFGHPFPSKKLPICTQNSDLKSVYILPIWGFPNYYT